MIREIAELGHPALRAAVEGVAWPLSGEDRGLADDLLETMLGANGVGIAAPQVGASRSIFVVASRPNPRYPDAPSMEPLVVINPEIVERSGEIARGWEGCLSIPGLRGIVPRHRRIVARFRTVGGEQVEREFVDFVARIFQHEDDHLRGLVFLDRLESSRDLVTEKEYLARFSPPAGDR